MIFSACANGSADKKDPGDSEGKIMEQKLYITIDKKVSATLEDNTATKTLIEKLKKGKISYKAHDYGGFEKVGDLGFSLPDEDRQMTSKPGDIFLYTGSSLVIFYGENSWSYTKIGTLDGMSRDEVKEFLKGGMGDVTVTLSLE